MITKEKLYQSIKDLPDKFSLNDFLDRIVLLQKIEIGIEQSKESKTKSMTEAKEILRKYF